MKDTNSHQLVEPNGNGSNGNGSNGNGKHSHSDQYILTSLLPLVNQNKVEEEEESLDLRQLWTVARHRLPLIGGVAVGFTTLVTIWSLTRTPVYQGKFQVLVEPPTQNSQTSQISSQLSLLGTDMAGTVDYDTQIEVLRSPDVLKSIVDNIASKYPGFQYGDLIAKKSSPLTITQVEETKILEITYENPDKEKIQEVLKQLAEGYLTYSLDERQAQVKQAIDFADSQLPVLQQRVELVQDKLQRFRQQNNLISPDDLASRLSQQLTALQTQQLDTRVQLNQAQSLYGILQKQIGLQPKEVLVSSYLAESSRYQSLLNQLQDLEIRLAGASLVFNDNTPNIKALREQRDVLLPLLRKEAEAALGTQFSQNLLDSPLNTSPSVLRLQLNQQFIQATNDSQVLLVRLQALEAATNQLNEKIKFMPVIAREYANLQREVGLATESLNRFLAAKENLQIQAAQQALPWRVISPANTTENPIFPRPKLFFVLGLIGGTLLGFGAAFLAEKFDPVFHSADELKDAIKLPILGLIPQEKDLNQFTPAEVDLGDIQIGDQKISGSSEVTVSSSNIPSNGAKSSQEATKLRRYNASPFSEAFRSLYTNIRLLGSDTPVNSVVVSSSTPAEGKSTVSLNLAKAAAALGQRVLLVDADLRRPQVHERLNLSNEVGLSNVVATGMDLEEAIQSVPQVENLYVLSAGDLPPDPARILSSKRMQEVMQQLRTNSPFDLVIYDTPPLLGFADARILAGATSGVILVAKIAKTDRAALKQTIDQLNMSKVPILGVVANNVTRNGHGSYYGHYERYYGAKKS